ncbi:mycothiol conjugate amidase Mca [Aeromicrobium sp.]|uniref:mycothiol conjugate amidase Mca n=1 Tax=Aeromicrobium sp. TaxID=1871063 RepID=UPI0039E6E1F8
MEDRLRLMHVHAHPDDESSKGAASTARYVAEGVDVHVVTCTGGERGSILNAGFSHPDVDAENPDPEVIARIRKAEMERARDILGVTQDWLGWVDSGWPEGDPKPPLPEGCFALVPLEEAAAPLVRLIRSFRPHVLTTYDENGGYPHPDHIKCHEISVFAYEAAADPQRYPDLGEPWQVSKLYYHGGWTRARLEAIGAAMEARGLKNPYEGWFDSRDPSRFRDDRVTTRVECAEYFATRDAALLAHATQIDPDGFWFSVPREVQAEAWPTEDFELVDAKVPTTLPETDVFAGLR